jgi:hypothetical protein
MLPDVNAANRAARRRALIIACIAGIIIFVLWNIPQISQTILYPFHLFVTYVHEAGHGTMALLTGGQFLGFEIFANGAGQALTAGGSRLLILPAGYLGAALFGAVLFYITNIGRYSRSISITLGIGLLIFSVIFGRFSMTAFVVGAAFAAVLIVIGLRANRDINLLILNMLAILTGLNAVLDLLFLVSNSSATLGDVRNDAAAFSAEVFPLIPGAVWALIWALLAVAMLGVSIWYSVIRPMRSK